MDGPNGVQMFNDDSHAQDGNFFAEVREAAADVLVSADQTNPQEQY